MVFQEDRLLEHLDALGNLHFALGPDLREEEALALLRELGLEDVGKKRVRDYSGGMKRRLALARALLAHSDALILDEPFSGLDEESRRKALRAVGRAAADQPVLLVTHEEEDAVALQATIIKLNKPAG